jgi:hypothetical protein
MVDGATRLQMELQPHVHTIKISTGKVQATDFDKMNQETTQMLVNNGRNATKTFFDQERIYVRSLMRADTICYDKDEFYCRVAQALEFPIERLIIAENNTDWVYKLLPSILCLRHRGVRVDAILPEHGDKKGDGPYRRRLLRALGVNMVNISILEGASFVPVRATVICPHNRAQMRAIVGVEIQPKSEADSVLYQGYLDLAVIGAVFDKLEALAQGPEPETTPSLVKGDEEELIAALKLVTQYSLERVKISIERVTLAQLIATSRLTREYKYNQIRHLIDLYRRCGLELFEPAAVELAGGFSSIVTPPVVEEVGEGFVIIEGSTRATFCRDEGILDFKCVVVCGVSDPMPSRTYDLAKVRVTGRALPVSERYDGWQYEHFRHIEVAAHPTEGLQ